MFACRQVDARFCEDFDQDDAATNFVQWPNAYAANGGSFLRADSDASAPFGVRFATVPAPTDGAPIPFAFMGHGFPGSQVVTKWAHFSVAFRVEKYPSAPTSFFTSTAVSLDGQSSVGLVASSKDSAIQQTVVTEAGTSYPAIVLPTILPTGKWVQIDMDFNVVSSPITLEVRFDGVTVLAPTALDPALKAGTPALTLGETYVDSQNDGVVFMNDNVVFDFN